MVLAEVVRSSSRSGLSTFERQGNRFSSSTAKSAAKAVFALDVSVAWSRRDFQFGMSGASPMTKVPSSRGVGVAVRAFQRSVRLLFVQLLLIQRVWPTDKSACLSACDALGSYKLRLLGDAAKGAKNVAFAAITSPTGACADAQASAVVGSDAAARQLVQAVLPAGEPSGRDAGLARVAATEQQSCGASFRKRHHR